MGMWENGSTVGKWNGRQVNDFTSIQPNQASPYGVPSFEDHPLEIDPGSVGGNQIVFAWMLYISWLSVVETEHEESHKVSSCEAGQAASR